MKKAFIFCLLLALPAQGAGLKAYLNSLFTPNEQMPTKSPIPRVALIAIETDSNFKEIETKLVEAAKNDRINGIILTVDNFGGSTGAFSVLHDLIKKITTLKPIVCLIRSGALSCGYLLASATNHIIAHTSSDIGCIGIFIQISRYKKPHIKGTVEAELEMDTFVAGEFKMVFDPYTQNLSPSQREHLQNLCNETYQWFLKSVSTNRSLSMDTYKEWAEGKIFPAFKALELRLIDQIGTIFEAEEKIVELIKQKDPAYTLSTTFESIKM